MLDRESVVSMLEALLGLEGVCSVTIESPTTICEDQAVRGDWWCFYHHHYESGDTSNDYAYGPTPLAAVQAAYDDQLERVSGRTKAGAA